MSVRERVIQRVKNTAIMVDDQHQVHLAVGFDKFTINQPCCDERQAAWLKDKLAKTLANLILQTSIK